MPRTYISIIVGTALFATLSAASPAVAQHRHPYEHGWYDGYDGGWDDGYRGGRANGWRDGYDRGRRDARRQRNADYAYRARHGRRDDRCRQSSGTGGLIVGGVAGGLLGREIAGDETVGALIGGGLGALAGRAIERGGVDC